MKPLKRKSTVTTTKKRRPAARSGRKTNNSIGKIAGVAVPLFFILCIVTGLGFLTLMGYRTVTASEFFDVKKVDVRGTSRASREEIEKIVSSQTERSGSWNADLVDIQQRIEKLMFVKHAAVSRVLPHGVRVDVTERVPQAIVRLGAGDFLVDAEGVVLTNVSKPEQAFPFVMRGWDESKTEKSEKNNIDRVKLYQKLLEEWQSYELAARVKEVDLTDPRDPKAMIEDSGTNVSIAVGKESYGKRLKAAVDAVSGKGIQVGTVDATGGYPSFGYRNQQ